MSLILKRSDLYFLPIYTILVILKAIPSFNSLLSIFSEHKPRKKNQEIGITVSSTTEMQC